ncbi:uncharacterized protein BHQ10_005979 [Talaromyces amestolkiae]|jgi:uncharacterized surface protein with fasciclin (FAS1) repeats|uniref:FAS1 domain-containing protein n=1 Tax=Talaromyces amestolkiae TaxID=1196081 RepID=A0A364L2D7_TALAM|nr:uncharacterized protein BHQ10_005979 [Talaromyces amestolkiae]RAO69967.1 hypothetical protein BHQ10_005979 [Talaromyces amestolkiae]
MKATKLSLLALMPSAIVAQNLTQLLANTTQLSSLNALLSSYPGIANSLANITNVTILAPSNDALANFTNSTSFKALASSPSGNKSIEDLLSYHILQGEYYASNITDTPAFIHTYLNDTAYTNVTSGQVVEAIKQDNDTYFYSGLFANSTVTQADLNFTGGVVHIIDKVLTVPLNVSSSAAAAGLSALVGALQAEKLTQTVDELKNVTIFAPANSAFQAIGSALGNLTADQLSGILEYHVLNGTLAYSTDLKNDTQYTAVDGRNITVRIENGSVFVDSARVVTPNLLVANGVVHVIDNVLNPNNTSATPNATATSQVPAFSGASSASAIPFTSGVTASATVTGTGAGAGAGVTGTSSSTAGAMPMRTAGMGAAMVFGAGAALLNADVF